MLSIKHLTRQSSHILDLGLPATGAVGMISTAKSKKFYYNKMKAGYHAIIFHENLNICFLCESMALSWRIPKQVHEKIKNF